MSFINALCEKAGNDERIFLLTGDLGFNVLEKFSNRFPDRFLNVGVAEQNLISVAAGLSTMGYIPFVYSIASFMTMRPYECIRSVIDLQNLNVKIVGIGAGVAYGKAGPTHYALEDISLMRSLRHMIIINPSNQREVASAIHALNTHDGPAYLRIEKNPDNEFQTKNGETFVIGRGECIKKGRDMAILTTGTKISLALDVANLLEKHTYKPSIYAFPTLYPIDETLLSVIEKQYRYIATIEEHYLQGGLGTIVTEFLANSCSSTKRISFGFQKSNDILVGDYTNIMKSCGLAPEQITRRLVHFLSQR